MGGALDSTTILAATAAFATPAGVAAAVPFRPGWWWVAVAQRVIGGIPPMIQAVTIRVAPVFARHAWPSLPCLRAQAALTMGRPWLVVAGRLLGSAPRGLAGAPRPRRRPRRLRRRPGRRQRPPPRRPAGAGAGGGRPPGHAVDPPHRSLRTVRSARRRGDGRLDAAGRPLGSGLGARAAGRRLHDDGGRHLRPRPRPLDGAALGDAGARPPPRPAGRARAAGDTGRPRPRLGAPLRRRRRAPGGRPVPLPGGDRVDTGRLPGPTRAGETGAAALPAIGLARAILLALDPGLGARLRLVHAEPRLFGWAGLLVSGAAVYRSRASPGSSSPSSPAG